MAAVDTIANMSNSELIWYYEYCMVQRFSELRFQICGHYHPSYAMNSIPIGKKIHNLHYPNEMYLLNTMWDRYINSESFAIKCWWEAKKIFSTRITFNKR